MMYDHLLLQRQAFGPSCPSDSIWYACPSGSNFVGCCASDDPCANSCPDDDLRPASFDVSYYGQFPDQECPAESQWYTCADTEPPFMGCCKSSACDNNGCSDDDLAAGFLSSNPTSAGPFLSTAASSAPGTAPASSSSNGAPSSTAASSSTAATSSAASSSTTSSSAASSSTASSSTASSGAASSTSTTAGEIASATDTVFVPATPPAAASSSTTTFSTIFSSHSSSHMSSSVHSVPVAPSQPTKSLASSTSTIASQSSAAVPTASKVNYTGIIAGTSAGGAIAIAVILIILCYYRRHLSLSRRQNQQRMDSFQTEKRGQSTATEIRDLDRVFSPNASFQSPLSSGIVHESPDSPSLTGRMPPSESNKSQAEAACQRMRSLQASSGFTSRLSDSLRPYPSTPPPLYPHDLEIQPTIPKSSSLPSPIPYSGSPPSTLHARHDPPFIQDAHTPAELPDSPRDSRLDHIGSIPAISVSSSPDGFTHVRGPVTSQYLGRSRNTSDSEEKVAVSLDDADTESMRRSLQNSMCPKGNYYGRLPPPPPSGGW